MKNKDIALDYYCAAGTPNEIKVTPTEAYDLLNKYKSEELNALLKFSLEKAIEDKVYTIVGNEMVLNKELMAA